MSGSNWHLRNYPTAGLSPRLLCPTRAFGAAFVSLGMVVSDAAAAAARDNASQAAHFEALFDLPPGTNVIFRPKTGKTLKGVMQAPEECDGKLCVRVQVHHSDGGGLTYILDESRASQVQPARHSGKLPKKQGELTPGSPTSLLIVSLVMPTRCNSGCAQNSAVPSLVAALRSNMKSERRL